MAISECMCSYVFHINYCDLFEAKICVRQIVRMIDRMCMSRA